MKEMLAGMAELGLPLPKDENIRAGDEIPSYRQVSELPDSFERESSKFWLQRSQVVTFVDMVTQRLGPYKFKGQKDSFNVITSIYLDNDAFDLYASRVARRDGAQLVRFRWYFSSILLDKLDALHLSTHNGTPGTVSMQTST
jgi:SPX domain protein involved in polyphosphate accumulation